MNARQIENAVEAAGKGIEQYVEITRLFKNVNVSTDRDFQRKFNAFYRVRQRSQQWYQEYYDLLERLKGVKPTFPSVLRHLLDKTGRYEASFSSKLLATIDVDMPIWDKYVLQNLGIEPPPAYSKNRFHGIVVAYSAISKWYSEYIHSSEGKAVIKVFGEHSRFASEISDTKKVDFVLWQTRIETFGPGYSCPGKTGR